MTDNTQLSGNCPIERTLSIVGGKWKWFILFILYKFKIVRYSEIKVRLPRIAHKTLSQQLKDLENSGVIHREQYNQIPPKVEYSLTDKGKTLIPMLELMYQWGKDNS